MTDGAAFLVDVRSILEDLGATIQIEADTVLPEITVGDETFAPVRPAQVTVTITNTGAGIVADGTVDAEFEAVCSRCLCEFPLLLSVPLEGFYVLPGAEGEIPEEQEYGYVQEGSIDLMEQILATFALELPFAPVHDDECPGICPTCGADLNEGPCECQPEVSHSPFAILKDLLPPGEEG